MHSSESSPNAAVRMRKVLVPFRDQPDFPMSFPVRLVSDFAETRCIREDAILIVDYVAQENPDHDRGVLHVKMVDLNGTPRILTKICSPESWPWLRERAFGSPDRVAFDLLKEWDPTGPNFQMN